MHGPYACPFCMPLCMSLMHVPLCKFRTRAARWSGVIPAVPSRHAAAVGSACAEEQQARRELTAAAAVREIGTPMRHHQAAVCTQQRTDEWIRRAA